MAIHGSSSESGTPVSGEGDQHKRDQDVQNRSTFDAVETSPYYMPIPQTITQLGEQNRPDPSPSGTDMRGTKRAREPDAENERHAPRRHGKRLTTREEISLFEICNRHASSFGRRSDICNWWKTIAAEFTQTYSRPYSWHSVRRKVEMVTKQRIKFLEDRQRRQDLDQEMMNPQWCAVLDEWIPTWQRWEESEARRFQQRDDMLRRRSQPRRDIFDTLEALGMNARRSPDVIGIDADIDDLASEAADDPVTLASPIPAPAPATIPPATHAVDPFPRRMANTVKMPPGFETMFSRPQPPRPRTPPIPASIPTPSPIPNPPSDGPMVNAVIETLGKLNKHLDAAAGSGSNARPSPVVSALGRVAVDSTPIRSSQEPHRQRNTPAATSLDLARIKEELRQEMLVELHRHRVEVQDKLDLILHMLRRRAA